MSAHDDIELPININQIIKYMPHRYPFLLVDRVIELEPNNRIKAIKNVTINEHFFVGHFPDYPVMPGVLIIEAMAQVSGILTMVTNGVPDANTIHFFAGINNAKFKRQVIPGDTLVLDVSIIKEKRGISIYNSVATVDGNIAALAELTIAKKEVK
jgi:3-hydroxyacyl-[acyl-carrier-protein] dehydratase